MARISERGGDSVGEKWDEPLALLPGYRDCEATIQHEHHTRLLTHELAHEYSSDHLSADYHKAICRLAGKLLRLALDEPEFFTGFRC